LLTQNLLPDIRQYSDFFTHFSRKRHQLNARKRW